MLVETTSLSFAELPKVTYNLHLPAGILQPKTDANPLGGALSRAQLETIVYACQVHLALLALAPRAMDAPAR